MTMNTAHTQQQQTNDHVYVKGWSAQHDRHGAFKPKQSVARFWLVYFYCYMYVWYMQVNEYFFTDLLSDFMAVDLYSQWIGSGPRGLVSTGCKAPWSWRIFIKQIQNLNISKHKHNSFWSFSPTSELGIISRWHVDRCQVLSTIDRRPLPVGHTQRPAICTAQWWLDVTQHIARSVGVNQDL